MFTETTYAFGMVNPKTTALFFDKLWVFPTFVGWGIPQQVCMDEIVKAREYYFASMNNGMNIARRLTEVPKSYRELSKGVDDFDRWADEDPSFFSPDQPGSAKHRNEAIYSISSFYRRRGVNLVPIYFSSQDFNQVNKEEEVGLQLCLEHLPMVDEAKLDWKQVLEFRKDKEARNKLTHLRQWFSTDLVKKKESEVHSLIEKKLDEYEWALKKHGIQTFVGGLTSVIPILVGPSFIQLVQSNSLEITLGGLALVSGAIAWITTRKIEQQDIRRSEVAYIYDVQRLLAK